MKRAFKWLSLASLAAVTATLMAMGTIDGPEAVFGLILMCGWIGGPLALPYLLSWSDSGGSVRRYFILVFCAEAAFSVWMFHDVLSSDRSTAALGLFVMPAFSWFGLLAAALLLAATGWRPTLTERAP